MSQSWDYLVIGAGVAGGLLAAGLAADGRASVLVLEAGPKRDRRGPRPAVRPHVLEFDAWVRAGATGWGPEDLLPHFRSLETDHDVGRARGHGNAGPVPVRRSPEGDWRPQDRAFVAGALQHGHPWAPDHNAAGALGVSPLALTAQPAGPVDTAELVRDLLSAVPGVTVLYGAIVERLRWAGSRVVGAEATVRGRPRCYAAGEVILCAGGLGSPAVLQRSGVGPDAVLRAAGVQTRVDLPVGQGIQTHPVVDVVGVGAVPDEGAEVGLGVGTGKGGEAHAAHERRSFGMFARWNTGLEGATSGDLMAWASGDGAALRITGSVAQVLSRGTMAITGPSAEHMPSVDPALLVDPLDRYRLPLVVAHLCDLVASQGLSPHLGPPGHGDPVSLSDPVGGADDWARGAVRESGHFSSGCRMGPEDDPTSVVDPAARVQGADGLRVADASVMPQLVKADPWLTSAVIGRRVAELMGAPAASPMASREAPLVPGQY